MRPESQEGYRAYIEARDCRNRWREQRMRSLHGDMDAFKAYVLEELSYDAEVAWLRECADFAESEEMLTPEMGEAVRAIEAWCNRLRDLCTQDGISEVAA